MRIYPLIIGVLLVGAAVVWGVSPEEREANPRFEAHEFAVFRSEYEALRVQAPEKRIDHFRNLLEQTEDARMTPGMAESLADFCRSIATAEEEVPEVQSEARLVVRTLESKLPARLPASETSKK